MRLPASQPFTYHLYGTWVCKHWAWSWTFPAQFSLFKFTEPGAPCQWTSKEPHCRSSEASKAPDQRPRVHIVGSRKVHCERVSQTAPATASATGSLRQARKHPACYLATMAPGRNSTHLSPYQCHSPIKCQRQGMCAVLGGSKTVLSCLHYSHSLLNKATMTD